MFSVFEHTLKTSKGKSIVRKHLSTFDARKVYQDLKQTMMGTAKGNSSRKKILQLLVTAKYGKSVIRCSAEHFDIFFREKFRLLDELHSDTSSGFSDETRVMLLQDAVSAIPELDRVRTDQKLLSKDSMTFDEYADILEQAAIEYDEQLKENKIDRTTYFLERGAQDDTDLLPISEYPMTSHTYHDMSMEPPYSIHNLHQGKPPVKPKSHPATTNASNHGIEKNERVADDVWQALPSSYKKAILEAKKKSRAINVCDLEEMDPDAPPSVEPPKEEEEEDEEINPILEYLCGNTENQPSYGDIREVLATKRDPKTKLKPKKSNPPDSKEFQMNQHVTTRPTYEVKMLERTDQDGRPSWPPPLHF
jgi:hypothetical protein